MENLKSVEKAESARNLRGAENAESMGSPKSAGGAESAKNPVMTAIEIRDPGEWGRATKLVPHDGCCAVCQRGTLTEQPNQPPYAMVIDASTHVAISDSPASNLLGLTPTGAFASVLQAGLQLRLRMTERPLREIIEDLSDVLTEIVEELKMHLGKMENFHAAASLGVCRQVTRNGEERWGILLLGDATAVVEYANGKIEVLENPNREKLRKMQDEVLAEMINIVEEAKREGRETPRNVFEALKTPRIQKMLTRIAERANTPDGYWALGLDREAAMNAARYEIPCREVKTLILHNRGFNYSILGMSGKEMLQRCKTPKGLEEIWNRIRKAETRDADGELQPRFAQHEDMAVVLVECNPTAYA